VEPIQVRRKATKPVPLASIPQCEIVYAYLNNRWVLLGAFLELVVRQFGVFVEIHVSEDLVHTLPLASDSTFLAGMSELLTFSGVSSSSGSLTIWPVIL
jgi:hypothetical protein